MPEILADQHPHPTETSIECPDGRPPCEESTFIKHTVGWQVDLVVNMKDLTHRKVGGCDIKPMTGILMDKANHQVNILASQQ